MALRYLFARKSHHAVNVISRISVAGVAVATAAIVCVLSVFNGFSQLTAKRLSVIDPELSIVPDSGKVIADADSLASALIEHNHLFIEAAPVVEERAMALYGSRQAPVRITGVPDGYNRVVDIENAVIDGQYIERDGDYSCATLSVGAALSIDARPGYTSPLIILEPRRRGRINPAAPMTAFRADTLLVSAVYEVEQNEADADRIIIPLESARGLLQYTTEASAVHLRLAPGADAAEARRTAASIAGPSCLVLDRLEQQAESFRMISVEKWITFAMLAFILAIATFNVISTMSMLIIEKRADIATLRAMGAAPSTIRRIFLAEGWFISALGGLAGIIIGVALCLLQQSTGLLRLNGDPSQLSITAYPVHVEPTDILIVLALTLLTGLLAGTIASAFASHAEDPDLPVAA